MSGEVTNQNALDVKSALSQGLTEGRIVHYVLPDGRSAGEHRPAMVVRVWGDVYPEPGVVNLHVFTDFDNDGQPDGTIWATSVHHSEDKKPGTWHWIEKA